VTGPIRYARSGDVNIAYQVTGQGPFDLVLVPGFFSHLEIDWEHPDHARFLERLGSFARLIRFDKRGTGLSDRSVGLPDFETRMDDVRAVMDAAGSDEAALLGYSEGGPLSVLFSATYPDRTRALVLYGSYAKRSNPDEDYPWAPTYENRSSIAAGYEAEWGEFDVSRLMARADPAMVEWYRKRGRASLSPAGARDLVLMNARADVRELLTSVHTPTLVLHRTGDPATLVEEGRYLADKIPGARFVELSGDVHVPWVDMDPLVDEIEEFLTGSRPPRRSSRVLATILFTDLVSSTDRLRELGDGAWAALLERHHAEVRRELGVFSGEEIGTTGDGFLALFDGPGRAIRCAVAIRASLAALGLEVRAGIHTGEVERAAELGGIAVHLAARVLGEAGGGEILVTRTTRDLVEGSGLVFEDRGARELKGIQGPRALYAVV
jgi:class 3 adenylate cyclase/pimeloyl-ACP methyl ester carboxylesterase